MNRRELIHALKAERDGLQKRIDAIDAALVGFGEERIMRQSTVKRRGKAQERDTEVLKWVQAQKVDIPDRNVPTLTNTHQKWVVATEVMEALAIPRGSVHGILDRLVEDGQLLKDTDSTPAAWSAP